MRGWLKMSSHEQNKPLIFTGDYPHDLCKYPELWTPLEHFIFSLNWSRKCDFSLDPQWETLTSIQQSRSYWEAEVLPEGHSSYIPKTANIQIPPYLSKNFKLLYVIELWIPSRLVTVIQNSMVIQKSEILV